MIPFFNHVPLRTRWAIEDANEYVSNVSDGFDDIRVRRLFAQFCHTVRAEIFINFCEKNDFLGRVSQDKT